MTYLKAKPDEPKVERIANHHKHVEKAIDEFNKAIITEFEQAEFTSSEQGNLGAQVAVASNLLSTVMQTIEDEDLKVKVAHLKALVERGVITSIAMRLQRMARLLTKGKMTRDDAVSQIYEMAIRYEPYYQSESDTKKKEETSPDIILSESYK